MRIVAGRWAGRDLTSPGGRVRPTAEAVRERCMELVAGELDGATVLDLYAGTGALGLEAMSRGAKTCDFVEYGASALHALKANVAALRVKKRTRLFKRDALPFIGRLDEGTYDIAFVDPPYGSKQADRVVERWLDVPFSRVLVVEHATGHALPARRRSGTERLGDTAVTVYRAATARHPRDRASGA